MKSETDIIEFDYNFEIKKKTKILIYKVCRRKG